jgi:Predicted amidophosphoribosyltransferases
LTRHHRPACRSRSGVKNLRGAFACDSHIRGKRIAIVDDVMTSGSTLDALAETLLKGGALEVQCWVVARALQHGF